MSRQLTVAFDAFLPTARWGTLFQVLRLEQPDLALDWKPVGFPIADRPLLEGADVGLLVQPPARPGLTSLALDLSEMVVIAAVGHPLTRKPRLKLADVLSQPFPRPLGVDPQYTAFWTLDAHRGGPPRFCEDGVGNARDGLEAVAAGRAISTLPAWAAEGLPHPGVVALLLDGAPPVATKLVWRSDDDHRAVLSLVELAAAVSSAG